MEFIRFSLLNLLLTLICGVSFAQERFSSKSCLDSKFTMKMSHQGALFGLMNQEFIITKKGCVITVSHKKYFPKEWIIDVCREPVHIKVSSVMGVNVAKKVGSCTSKETSENTSDFCAQYAELMGVIQDEGLIFAEGDRDDLSSPHGKTYCSYLLIDRYLKDSLVFSRFTEVPDIFVENLKPIVEQIQAPKEKLSPPEVKAETLPKAD
jgi:hypothetical protein